MIPILALTIVTLAPDTLTLQQCYREADEAWPLRQQLILHDSISELRTRNLDVSYLPSLEFSGQAVYHTEVPDLQLPAADITPPSNDQYRVSVGISQLVYDGGTTAQLKALQQIQRDLEQGKVEVELYKLREQVNVAYFGALMFESQLAVLRLLKADLEAKHDEVNSLVRNGVLTRSNADMVAAEIISVEQQAVEARAGRRAALGVLSELIGRPVPPDAVLILPQRNINGRPGLRKRPEYRVFDLSRSVLAGRSTLLSRRQRPTLSAFAETAIGRPPGLNFFETDFKPFYSVGLRMTWSPWKWRSSRRDRQVLDLESRLVETQESAFSKQISIALRQQTSDIAKLEDLLARDEEIVSLREQIAREAASQLRNGVITAADYLRERNAESRARLLLDLHRIQLAKARASYMTTIGEP